MHLYHSCASWISVKALRLDRRIDLAPLPQPILADSFSTAYPAAFHAVRPIDVGVHGGQNGINVAAVECLIYLKKQVLLSHLRIPLVISIKRLRERATLPA